MAIRKTQTATGENRLERVENREERERGRGKGGRRAGEKEKPSESLKFLVSNVAENPRRISSSDIYSEKRTFEKTPGCGKSDDMQCLQQLNLI